MASSENNLNAVDNNGVMGNTAPSEVQKRVMPDWRKCAANLETGLSLRAAMLDAGYTEKVANRGLRSIPKKVLKLMGRGSKNLIALGKITAEDQEQLVRGRLAYNTIRGQDKGVMSAYRLGQDRRVNMFVAESQTGIMVIQAPIREIGLDKPNEEPATAETGQNPEKKP